MSSAIVKYDQQYRSLKQLLERSKGEIAKALPRHISPDRMIRIALTTIRKTPKLLEADPVSVLGAVMEASQLGLEIDGVLGHAYLVPFRNTKAKRLEAVLIPGYRGLIDLAYRSGKISYVQAEIIYENDYFECSLGTNPVLKHVPTFGERGEPVGAWALVRMVDGQSVFKPMTKEEILEHKKHSKSADSGELWTTYWEWAWKKTVLRQLLKTMPLTPEAMKAIIREEYAEAGFVNGVSHETTGLTDTEAAAIRVEQLKQHLKSSSEEAHEVEDSNESNAVQEPATPENAHEPSSDGARNNKQNASQPTEVSSDKAFDSMKQYLNRWIMELEPAHRLEWETLLKMAKTVSDLHTIANNMLGRYHRPTESQLADLEAAATSCEAKRNALQEAMKVFGLTKPDNAPMPVFRRLVAAVDAVNC